MTHRRFVIVSGLPASGKTTLGWMLASALDLRLIDKDDILESLFESRGIGDASWRQKLSRESDALLRENAESSEGAILVSCWHVSGMPEDSGTPTDWIPSLSRRVVNVLCECARPLAAERFARRERHAGHLDGEKPRLEDFPFLGQSSCWEAVSARELVRVDTSRVPNLESVVRQVQDAFARCLNPVR